MEYAVASATNKVRGELQGNDARRLLLHYFDEVLNRKNLDAMEEIFAADVVYHSAGAPDINGLQALKAWVADYLNSVPDYKAAFKDSIAEGDRCMLRWSCKGTHRGVLFGLPPTGKRFTLSGMTVFRIQDGRVQEGWIERDSLGLFRHLQS